jgi:BMFP domain-containing protein YqiC
VFEMLADMLLEAVSDIARLTARIEELEARSPGRVSSGVSGVTTKEK